jgi:hypothetical protein
MGFRATAGTPKATATVIVPALHALVVAPVEGSGVCLDVCHRGVCGGGHRRVFQLRGLPNPQAGRQARGALATQWKARANGFSPRNCTADRPPTTAHSIQAARRRRRIAGSGVSPRLLMYLKVAPTVR